MPSAEAEAADAPAAGSPVAILVTTTQGQTRSVPGLLGQSLMEALRDAGIDDLPAYCGGVCSCASCHIAVAAEWLTRLPVMGEAEADLLASQDNRTAGSRLSCQIPVSPALDGLPVTTAYVE